MSVQLENGYLRIANDLMDALLSAPISGRQMKVIMAIIRKTYGFNKKTDDIGLSQLRDMTGIDRSHLSRAIASLVEANVLTKKDGSYAHNIGLNKDFSTWIFDGWEAPETVAETATVAEIATPETVAETATQPVAERATGYCRKSNPPVADSATPLLPKEQPQKTTPKDKPKRQTQKRVSLPAPDFGGKDLADAWAEFLQYRTEIGKPMTETAAKKAIAVLAGKRNPVEMIEKSIISGWTGLFDLKDEPKKRQQIASDGKSKAYRMHHLGFVEVHSVMGGMSSWSATGYRSIEEYENAQLEAA